MKNMNCENDNLIEAAEEQMLSAALKSQEMMSPLPAELSKRFYRRFASHETSAGRRPFARPTWRAAAAVAALCAVGALGAATTLAVARLLSDHSETSEDNAEFRMQNAECGSPMPTPVHSTGGTGATGGTGDASITSTTSNANQGDKTMNTTKQLLAASAAIAMAAGAPQAATAAMDDWHGNATSPVVVIVVDVDMSLSDALTANNVSLSGAASLVKLGNGTVTADDASGIGSFAGDIHVFAGGWSVGTAAGFGTSAGSTWVYPNGCVFVTDVTVAHTGETFHLAGTGKSDWYGWGAIRFPSSSQESAVMAAGAYGSRWILEDDATVLISGKGNSGTFLPAIDLELNGHELTLWRGRYGRIETTSGATSRYGMFHSVTGAGGIVMENGTTFAQWGFNPPSYTAGNYLALQNAYLGIWETKNLHADWGLVAKPLPAANWDGSGSAANHKPMLMLLSWKGSDWMVHDFNMWQGPVMLQDNLQIAQENQNYIHPMTFTGKISGSGGLSVTSGKVWLYLDNPENDFQGGVTLAGPNDGLVLANNGALPADGGPLTLIDSSVSFPSTVSAPWSLPDLELAGASTVGNCQGSWKTITVLAGADAEYDSALGASNLILKADATLILGSTYSASDYYGYRMWYSTAMNGVYTFEQLRATGTKQDHASEKSGSYVYNWFNNALSSNTAYSPIGSNADGVIGYEGWVWCDGPDGTEWTFALSYGAGNTFYLKINDTVVFNFNHRGYMTAANTPRYNVAMKHGWNRFLGMTKYGWTAANSSDGLWTLKGLCVDKQGRCTANSSDYGYISDPGDGSSVVYMCGDDEADGYSWHGTFLHLAMETGSTLDLDALGNLSVETAKGAGTVDNGDLTVTQAWKVDPTIFTNNGGIAVDGDLVFGPGAKISFPEADDYRNVHVGAYTLATATGTVSGFTGKTMLDKGGQRGRWAVSLTADQKTLQLQRLPDGTVILVQ